MSGFFPYPVGFYPQLQQQQNHPMVILPLRDFDRLRDEHKELIAERDKLVARNKTIMYAWMAYAVETVQQRLIEDFAGEPFEFSTGSTEISVNRSGRKKKGKQSSNRFYFRMVDSRVDRAAYKVQAYYGGHVDNVEVGDLEPVIKFIEQTIADTM